MRRVRFSSSIRPTRVTAGLLGAALVLSGPSAVAATPQAGSASTWLARQLSSGLVQSEYQDANGAWQSYTDHGLALDVFLTLDRLDVRKAQQARIIEAMEPEADAYTGRGTTEYAGALGKLLSAVQAEGVDPGSYAAGDLLPRLEDRVQDSGPEAGRGKDAFDPTDPWAGDFSNSFGQSYVVTALTRAGSSESQAATRFLLDQQCDAGFFRESMGTETFTCDEGSSEESRPDIDATATVAITLRDLLDEVDPSLQDQVRLAASRATRWLVARQVRSGTFDGGRNTNSTGLAATALAAAGRDGAARKAAQWVNRFRVTPALARKTKLRSADVGAIAFNGAALQRAKKRGLERKARYEWRRATAQAAPALDEL